MYIYIYIDIWEILVWIWLYHVVYGKYIHIYHHIYIYVYKYVHMRPEKYDANGKELVV